MKPRPADLSEQHVRDFTRSCVRAGLLSEDERLMEVVQAIEAELPGRGPDHDADAQSLARRWIGQAQAELEREQVGWAEVTDHDLLQAAFNDLEAAGVLVLQGCADHWSAKAELDGQPGSPPRGIAWFTPPDVWHAIDEGMLEVNLWHATTANAAPGDDLLDEVLAVFESHGLAAHFDEGRIEIAAHWQKRLHAATTAQQPTADPSAGSVVRRRTVE